jgi:hypothetical protein
VELTLKDVAGVSAWPDFLDQIEHPVCSVTADSAYDAVLQRHPAARVIISASLGGGFE